MLHVARLMARMLAAAVVLGQGHEIVNRAGEEPSTERRVGHQAHAELAAGLDVAPLGIPRPQRVLDLQRDDGMHLVRPPDRVRAGFRQRYVTRFALLDESRHAANRFLDRNIGIDAGHAEDVQRFDAEPSQAFLAYPREVLRAATAALAR